jgi:tetratricopeptide (TPR) repeat protein
VCLDQRGKAYLGLGKQDLALADFNDSLRLLPSSPWTLTMRGNLHRDTGQLDLAIKDYSEAISQQPDYVDAFGNRADTYTLKEQYDHAIADANKTIELDRTSWLGYGVRGRAQMELGRLDEALRDLNQAVSLAPKNPVLHYFRALAEAKREENMYANCPKPGSRQSNTFGGSGPPVCMTGVQFNTSIRELGEAIQLNPDYSDAYAYRGALYLALRQRDNAVVDLRKALAINSKNKFARDTLRAMRVSP